MGLTERPDRTHRRAKAHSGAKPDEQMTRLLSRQPGRVLQILEDIPDPGTLDFTQIVVRLMLAAIIIEGERLAAGTGSFERYTSLLSSLGDRALRGIRTQRDIFSEAASLGDVLVARDDRIQVWEKDEDGNATTRNLTPAEMDRYREMIFKPDPKPPDGTTGG